MQMNMLCKLLNCLQIEKLLLMVKTSEILESRVDVCWQKKQGTALAWSSVQATLKCCALGTPLTHPDPTLSVFLGEEALFSWGQVPGRDLAQRYQLPTFLADEEMCTSVLERGNPAATTATSTPLGKSFGRVL